MAFVDGILELDRKAPVEAAPHRTPDLGADASRGWRRSARFASGPFGSTFRERKKSLGLVVNEVFVPAELRMGASKRRLIAYEAVADLAGERTKLQVFSMRSMASGACVSLRVLATPLSRRSSKRIELAFAFFCGVFLQAAFTDQPGELLGKEDSAYGQRREETALFIAFRSHWRFDSEFCTPAEGHEKGGVEGEAGHFLQEPLGAGKAERR